MSHLVNGPNIYTVDEERRLAHRGEIKRRLAEISVRKTRVSELKNIVAKLNADSEQAANQHSEQAGKLQSELDALDTEQIDCVLAGKSSPAKSITRRGEILNELAKLNQILEIACEGNRRAAKPIEKQIADLQATTTEEGALRNRLISLCSAPLRQRRLYLQHQMKFMDFCHRDAERMAGAIEHNAKVAGLNNDHETKDIRTIRGEDWRRVVLECSTTIVAIHRELAETEAQALAE